MIICPTDNNRMTIYFIKEIGATRNENHVQYERLAAIARTKLNETAPRVSSFHSLNSF